jgi:hypothetical protein
LFDPVDRAAAERWGALQKTAFEFPVTQLDFPALEVLATHVLGRPDLLVKQRRQQPEGAMAATVDTQQARLHHQRQGLVLGSCLRRERQLNELVVPSEATHNAILRGALASHKPVPLLDAVLQMIEKRHTEKKAIEKRQGVVGHTGQELHGKRQFADVVATEGCRQEHVRVDDHGRDQAQGRERSGRARRTGMDAEILA